jgi:hypothetical protein
LRAIGPGVTYYVSPTNVFVSGSVSLAQISYGAGGTSNWGAMGRVVLGKEWWISGNWGLGLGGEVLLGRMGGRSGYYIPESHFTAKGLSLLISVSFN